MCCFDYPRTLLPSHRRVLVWRGPGDMQALESRCLLSAGSAIAGAVYPAPLVTATQELEVSPNGHTLVKADGTPFFYLADTAWALLTRPSLAQADQYLEDRAAKGFDVIQAVFLDGRSDITYPILNNDPAQINTAFFTNADSIISEAKSLGLYVAIVPAWSSLVDTTSSIFNASNAYSYGYYIGNRYKNQNVIWLLGGDSANTNTTVWTAMANGLQAGDGGTELMSFHPTGGDSSSKWYQNDPQINFNMIDSGHSSSTANYNLVTSDYNLTPVKPTVDGESNYESIPDGLTPTGAPITDYDVRLKVYWGIFAGAMGATYGDMDVYQFWEPGLTPDYPTVPNISWQSALSAPGAVEMKYVAALMESRPLLNRIPDQSIIVGSTLSGDDHIQATRDSTGMYAMIYSAAGQSFTVDMTKVSGSTATAWWYNPRTGAATKIGNYATSGMRQFIPPTSGTDNDWVLVLDNASKGFSAPGQPLAATAVAFAQQPSASIAGKLIPPPVTVYLEDANGNLVTSDNSSITLTVHTGPGMLGGSVTAQAIAGVTSFSNLTLSSAGTYTLNAIDGALAPATSAFFTVSAAITGLPAPWVATSIGSQSIAGGAGYANGTFSITGSGADIYSTADGFEFVNQTLAGDGSMVARIDTQQDTNATAKSGVMIRAAANPASPFAAIFMTPGGAYFEYRLTQGGAVSYFPIAKASTPEFLKVTRTGSSFSGFISSNGVNWTQVGSAVTLNFNGSALAGLAVCSHNQSEVGTSTFDSVSLNTGIVTSSPLPSPWIATSIGSQSIAGGATYSNGTFSVTGSGADIYGSADGFEFVDQTLAGDGSISARIDSQQNTNASAKSGVMIRATTDPGSPFAAIFMTPGGAYFEYRLTQGGAVSYFNVAKATTPEYLEVTRTGNSSSGFISSNGVNWTQVGSAITLNFTGSALAGLAVCSHNQSRAGTSTFDNVSVNPVASPGAIGTNSATQQAGSPFALQSIISSPDLLDDNSTLFT